MLVGFSRRRRGGCLKFLGLGSSRNGGKVIKTPFGRIPSEEDIVALDGPGCGWLRNFVT